MIMVQLFLIVRLHHASVDNNYVWFIDLNLYGRVPCITISYTFFKFR